MKTKLFLIVLLANLLMSRAAFAADCEQPDEPALPNGEAANGSEMLKAKKEVEAYQAAMEEYLSCGRFSASQHNRIIDKVAKLVEDFNKEVREYKAKS